MSSKIKKLICSLLAATMVVSSASMLVFAEGEDAAAGDPPATTETAEGAEATPAPEAEATPAPEAEAPAATNGSSYDNDAYYQKSLALCTSLGIIKGVDDGSMQPDAKFTRSQMAAVVLRLLNLTASPYQNVFTDVASDHWAAGEIQAAYDAKLIRGMGDGRFGPDDEVTYAAVIVMLVNALNYGEEAEMYGGWQQGYIKIAGDKELLKNAEGQADAVVDRGLAIKMIYNTLLADYKRPSSFEDGSIQYSTDKTLAEDKFDVIEAKGLLIGTEKTTIGDNDIQEGQIEIKPDKETQSRIFDTILTDLDDCVARKVTYYYKENAGRTPEVLAVAYDASRSETVEIASEDIKDVTYQNGVLSVETYKTSKKRETIENPKVIYNGKLVSDSDVASVAVKPEDGKITMVRSDKNDVDDYDVVFIDAYETVVVTSANDDRIIVKAPVAGSTTGETENRTIKIDDDKDRTVTVTKMGEAIRARNLKKNDVASIRTSLSDSSASTTVDAEFVEIVVTGESITGTVASASVSQDETTVVINGDTYIVAKVAVADLKTGAQGTFYLDQFDKIGYIDTTGSSKLEAGEAYGWIMGGYKLDGGDFVLRLMTEEGDKEFKLASNVDYWAPKASEGSGQLSKSQAETELKKLFDSNGRVIADAFPASWISHSATGKAVGRDTRTAYADKGVVESTWRLLYMTQGVPMALVKYKANASGALTKVYGAVSVSNYAYSQYDHDYAVANWTADEWNAAYKELMGGNQIKSLDDFKDCLGWAIQPGQVASDYNAVEGMENLTADDIIGVKQPYYSKARAQELMDSDALVVNTSNNLNGQVLTGGLLGGYVITDDLMELTVPDTVASYSDAGSYSYKNITSGTYNQRENGINFDAFVADASGTTPGIIIRTAADPETPVKPNDIDTVGNYAAIVVDKIDRAVDADDETVYTIKGFTMGTDTSVTTKRTSALGYIIGSETRKYHTNDVWNGKDGGTDGPALGSYLFKGDAVITDGLSIVRLMSGREIYETLKAGGDVPSATYTTSSTRNNFYIGPVTNSDIDDVAWVEINGVRFSPDAGAVMDVVEVDLSAPNAASAVTISDDLATPADFENYYAGADEYDIAMARTANKGALQEIVIYRIKNANSAN